MLRDRQVSWQHQQMVSASPQQAAHDKYSKAPKIKPIIGCSFTCLFWCVLVIIGVVYYGVVDLTIIAPEGAFSLDYQFTFHHLLVEGSTLHTYLHGLYPDTDRSRMFNIKVLPANVQEKTLDSLSTGRSR